MENDPILARLPTEQTNPASAQLDQLGTIRILEVMNAADAGVAGAVADQIDRIGRAVDAIAGALERGGHLVYLGAGTSGRLGVLDASECPPTFNVPVDLVRGIIAGGERALTQAVEGCEDDRAAGTADLTASGFGPGDVLVGISASGRTPYVLGAIAEARRVGAITCAISCTPSSELSRAVDYPIEPVTGPEILTGSTRLKAGTATKMVLNMISTAALVKLGYVYQNLMVNVQPTNRKLENRAVEIIQKATGLAYDPAFELLVRAERRVPTAIVMEQKQVSREEAERLLAAARGRIREVISPQ